MKQYRFLFAVFAALTLSFSACSDDDATQQTIPMSSADSAKFAASYFGILNGMRGYNINTRHTIDSISTWAGMVSGRMSILLSGVVYDNYYVDASGNITASMGPYIFGTAASTYQAVAWYPYTPTSSGILASFTVKERQDTFANIEKSDLLIGAQTLGTTEINFYHRMSQIETHINLNRYKIVGNSIQHVHSYVKRVRFAGSYIGGSISDGVNGNITGVATNTLTYTPYADADGDGKPDTITAWQYKNKNTVKLNSAGCRDTSYSFRALIFPQTTTMWLLVDVYDATYGDTLYKGKVESWTYVPGVYYNIYVTITDQLSQSAKSALGRKGEAVEIKPTMIISHDEGQPWR